MTDLEKKIAEFEWWHSIDLGNGVVTAGKKPLSLHELESSAFFDSIDMPDHTFLDIGAWNGAYSFEAERRGAARVVASDHFVWNNEFRGRETIEIAKKELKSNIELVDIDAMDVSPESIGVFEIVLFAGVFYHQFDPIAGLEKAASVAGEVLIVETHIDLEGLGVPAMQFYPAEKLGDPTNWWGPNPALVIELLKLHGFKRIDVQKQGGRAIFHAWRSDKLRKSAPSTLPLLESSTAERETRLRRRRFLWRLFRELIGLR